MAGCSILEFSFVSPKAERNLLFISLRRLLKVSVLVKGFFFYYCAVSDTVILCMVG